MLTSTVSCLGTVQRRFRTARVMVVYRDGLPDCMLIGRLERTRLALNVGYTTLFRPHVRRWFFVQGDSSEINPSRVVSSWFAESCRVFNKGKGILRSSFGYARIQLYTALPVELGTLFVYR